MPSTISSHAEPNAMVAYCNCMDDIKQRLAKVNRILIGHSPMKDQGLDGEVVCLLLRKVLEQIVFSSLVAHKDAYAAVHKDFAQSWRVKKLLDRIENVHPDFYPKPISFPTVDTGRVRHMLDVVDGYLTKDDLAFLYDTCSDVLHTWNPFRLGPRVVETHRPLAEWVQRIMRLLDVHLIRLAGQQDVWVVLMNDATDGKVRVWRAEPR
jgi:hypothetical protein